MQSRIPFAKLWVHQERHQLEAAEAIQRVLTKGQFILGQEVESFEYAFCDFLGIPAGVAVGSGTDALTLGLLAGGISQGDEVLLPAFSPGATITAVLAAGAIPVLVDVTEQFELDLQGIEDALTERTRAIIIVHLFGRMNDMVPILKVAARKQLWVVEDCAHAHGASLWNTARQKWEMAGTVGDVGAFSFYPTKNLGAIGDGGFVCTHSMSTAHKLRELRQYGWRTRDDSETVGRNSRLDEIQAAVLRVGLRNLAQWNLGRRHLAALYFSHLQTDEAIGNLTCPIRSEDRTDVYHLFVIRTRERQSLIDRLSLAGIDTGIHYPKALSEQKAFRRFAWNKTFPTAERLAKEVLSLPMYPSLEEITLEKVASQVSHLYQTLCTSEL